MSTSHPSLEIHVEGGDRTKVDLCLCFDPPLILNMPDFISPSTVIHEHQISDDLVDPVVSVSASDHTDMTHPTLEVVPSHASVLKIGLVLETPLRLNKSSYVEVVTGPLEGHNIDAYNLFQVNDEGLVINIEKLVYLRLIPFILNYLRYFNEIKRPWPHP